MDEQIQDVMDSNELERKAMRQNNVQNASLSNAPTKKEINDSNNANLVKNAANMASKSVNPYAKAAGTAVKVADKLSGGKVSEKVGKKLTKANNLFKGNQLQKFSNSLSKNGTENRIGNALNKKNKMSSLGLPTKANFINDLKNIGKDDSLSSRKEVEESASDGGGANFKVSFKFIKIALIALIPAMVAIVFVNLLVSGPNVYLKVIGLSNADEISSEEAEKKINENGSDHLDDELNDDNVGDGLGYSYLNNNLNIASIKLSKTNLVLDNSSNNLINIEKDESSLYELEDFYSGIENYDNGQYDMDTVYKFFYKLMYIQRYYKSEYNVDLDMPLIMATLIIQSDDISEVFASNIVSYKISLKDTNPDFSYYADWTKIKLDKNKSSRDIEIIAQNMISLRPTNECAVLAKDGKCYKEDEEKYREFLKEFLEKKYFLDGSYSISNVNSPEISQDIQNDNQNNDNNNAENNSNLSNPNENQNTNINPDVNIEPEIPSDGNSSNVSSFAQAMVETAIKELTELNGRKDGSKYINAYGGFGPDTPWCAIFVWYVSSQTTYNGKKLYPDIIPFKKPSTMKYIHEFSSSDLPHINFYYNDSCLNLKGKNGDMNYIPKAGDYIFIDWEAEYYDISSNTQDHTAMVEKYEDGIIYTIEGNLTDTIARQKYSITDCRVIGFGSWY